MNKRTIVLAFKLAPVTTRLRLVGTMSARSTNLISKVGLGESTTGAGTTTRTGAGTGATTGTDKVVVAVTGDVGDVIPAYSAITRYEYGVPEVSPLSVNDVADVVDTVVHVRPLSADRCTVYVGAPAAVEGVHVTTVDVSDGVTCGAPGVVGGKPAVTAAWFHGLTPTTEYA